MLAKVRDVKIAWVLIILAALLFAKELFKPASGHSDKISSEFSYEAKTSGYGSKHADMNEAVNLNVTKN